jgi:hypothetical protein
LDANCLPFELSLSLLLLFEKEDLDGKFVDRVPLLLLIKVKLFEAMSDAGREGKEASEGIAGGIGDCGGGGGGGAGGVTDMDLGEEQLLSTCLLITILLGALERGLKRIS